MQIVIDRDKEVNKLKEMIDTLTDKKDLQSVRFAINILEDIDGTPLPKGHGRLIDGDKAIADFTNYGIDHMWDAFDLPDIIDESPIIIEADKEEE